MKSLAAAALAIMLCAALLPLHSAQALSKIVITTSSLTEREAALHVARDFGLFSRHGIDATVVQVRSGPLAIAALSSRESHLHWGSVTSANLGAIAAGGGGVFTTLALEHWGLIPERDRILFRSFGEQSVITRLSRTEP